MGSQFLVFFLLGRISSISSQLLFFCRNMLISHTWGMQIG